MGLEFVGLKMAGLGARWGKGLRVALERPKLEHYCEGLCIAGIRFKQSKGNYYPSAGCMKMICKDTGVAQAYVPQVGKSRILMIARACWP